MIRVLVGLLLVAILGIALLFWRSGTETPTSKPERASEAGTRPASTVTAPAPGAEPGVSAPVKPIRMRARQDGGSGVTTEATHTSLQDSYESEAVDSGWAAEQEARVREVVTGLIRKQSGAARIDALQCRTRHCRLHLQADSQDALADLVAPLQDDRGFLGKAQSMMLSREGDDVVVYLRFPERP